MESDPPFPANAIENPFQMEKDSSQDIYHSSAPQESIPAIPNATHHSLPDGESLLSMLQDEEDISNLDPALSQLVAEMEDCEFSHIEQSYAQSLHDLSRLANRGESGDFDDPYPVPVDRSTFDVLAAFPSFQRAGGLSLAMNRSVSDSQVTFTRLGPTPPSSPCRRSTSLTQQWWDPVVNATDTESLPTISPEFVRPQHGTQHLGLTISFESAEYMPLSSPPPTPPGPYYSPAQDDPEPRSSSLRSITVPQGNSLGLVVVSDSSEDESDMEIDQNLPTGGTMADCAPTPHPSQCPVSSPAPAWSPHYPEDSKPVYDPELVPPSEDEEEDYKPIPDFHSPRSLSIRSQSQSSLTLSQKRTFKLALWEVINDPTYERYICWSDDGQSGVIPDKADFTGSPAMRAITDARDAGGFIRQLHMWGFSRISSNVDKIHGITFSHPMFQRGREDLMIQMSRRGESKLARKSAPPKKRGPRGKKEQTSLTLSATPRKSTRQRGSRINYREADEDADDEMKSALPSPDVPSFNHSPDTLPPPLPDYLGTNLHHELGALKYHNDALERENALLRTSQTESDALKHELTELRSRMGHFYVQALGGDSPSDEAPELYSPSKRALTATPEPSEQGPTAKRPSTTTSRSSSSQRGKVTRRGRGRGKRGST